MKSFIVLLINLLFILPSFAGTSVGNFDYKNQIEFDFRVGYPKDWAWTSQLVQSNEVERWLLSNQKKISDPAHASTATFAFIANFPAKNDEELLKQIQLLHPGLRWTRIQNPDFTVGFTSAQENAGAGRTHNFDYYFSQKEKVIRIETFRDATQNGAAEIDTILSTIRRPSGAPKVVSISPVQKEQGSWKVGDRFCYRIEMDLLQNDFSKDNLMAFRFKGAHEHWSFNEINWNQKDSSFIACTKINEHFAADGLQIQSLTISSSSAQSTSCLPIPSQKSQSQSMFCGDKQIAYAAPVVDNPIPRTKAPQINSLQNGSRSNSISLDITSALPISSAEVTLDAMANGSSPISQLIYDDQISVGHSEITFNQSRIPPGFTRVVLINIVDTVGNASRLKAEPGEANYKLYSTDGPPTETQIPVISLMGPSK